MLDDLTPEALQALRALLQAVILAEPLQLTLLARYGIRLSELQALRLLRDLGSVPISQFAAALGISRSTATGVVDRLEARDLVRREPGTTDRRTVHITVTPHALTALEARALVRESALARGVAALAPADQRDLTALLARVTDGDARDIGDIGVTTTAAYATRNTW